MTLSQQSSKTRESRCSCEDCDSAECFSRRHTRQKCSCDWCDNSQSCLYPQTLDIPEPFQFTEENIPTPPNKKEVPSEIQQDLSNSTKTAVVTEIAEKVTSKSSNTAKNSKPSKIPISNEKVVSKSYSITKSAKRIRKNLSGSSSRAKATKANQKDPSRSSSTKKFKENEKVISKSSNVETFEVISDHKVRQKVNLNNLKENLVQELIKKEIIYVYNRNNKTITTKESKVSFRNIQADNYTDEESANSVDAKYSNKDIEFARSAARLAAKIMNIPYADFKSSLPESKCSNFQQVSKYPIDIFKRIKEAYKACSCKVCECIAGKAITSSDVCSCKPCDCNDCKHLTVNVLDSNLFPVDNDGCACIRCDRKDCKGITGNKAQPRICDCQIKEREIRFEKGCDCEPCQCIDCSLKSGRHRDTVVARVDQNYLNTCDCSPCECADCIRGYGISNEREATIRHEMSTGVNRHPQCQCEACVTEACVPDGNESCWCVRHSKVMSKPFQRNTSDYDISRAKLPFCFERKDKNRNDTLAMYASIINTYPQQLPDFKEKCSCDPCEYLVCNHKDNRECLNVSMEESVTTYRQNKAQEQFYPIKGKMREGTIGEHSIKMNKRKCGYNLCDCVNCETRKSYKDIPKPNLTKKMWLAGTCSCNPCECMNVLNEAAEDEKPVYDCQWKQFLNNVSNNPIVNHILTKSREEIDFHENYPCNKNCYRRKRIPQQCVSSRGNTVKLDSGICNFSNKEETDLKELRESPSVNSSMTYLKDSKSFSPITRNKKKSADSSCNSSGHDYPDYLIHFPKTTVQKCIDDVMKSSFMNVECVKINYMNNPPPMMPTSYRNAIKNNPIPNSPSFRQANTEVPRLTSDICSFTSLNVVSSKSSLHRTSGAIAIETTSKKAMSQYNITNDGSTIDTQKITTENNSLDLEDAIKFVDKKEVPKIKKHVTVNLIHDDLEKVQNTLTEAREFSKQLVQILEKYENANKNFDKVSKKFKTIGNPTKSAVKLQSEIILGIKNFKKDTDVGSTQCSESQNDIRLKTSTNATSIKPIQQTQSKSSGNILLKTNQSKSSSSVRKVDNNKNKKNAISNENKLLKKTNKNRVSLKYVNKNDVSVITEPAYIFKKETDNNNPLKLTKSNNFKDFLNTIAVEKVSDILSNVYKANNENKDKELRRKRNFNYLYKRTMTMSKKMNIMPRYENVKLKASVVTEESKTTPNGTEIKRNAVYASRTDDLTKDVATDNLKPTDVKKDSTNQANLHNKTDMNLNFVVKTENEIDNGNEVLSAPLSVSKNYQLDTESNDGLGNIDPKLLNLDLKEALKAILLESENVETDAQTVYRQENKALINLQSEVKKLLDMPLLQPFMEKINDICNLKVSESKYTNCSKTHTAEKEEVSESSFSFYNKPLPNHKYNSLKVNYVNIRHVSDDSLLVRWDPPQNLNYVEGYEVLIDGRAVHRILSPNKCNAVVTGLPISDNDKILLSIRTVTNIPDIERMPATTIIYRPHVAVY